MEKIAVNIGSEFGSPFGQDYGFADLVSIILSNTMVIAGIILLFLLIFGGISMIMGAGQDNPEAAAKGKQAATSAVIGFIIIFAAYWIIQIIETVTGLNILNFGK
jgi:hypothetical protein